MKKEAVMSWLRSHEQEQIEFLQQMIRIPSVTGNEGPIQEFMAKTLTEMGLAVDSFVPSLEELQKHPAYVAPAQPYEGRPDVVGTLKGAGGGRSLLFNGHIDVIPEGSLDNWQHDPWSADIADGKIRYDGINVSKIKKADLRRSLGIVLQDTNLFTGTVMDNIRYGNLDATDEQCRAAAELAGADDFIKRLPKGYDTELSNNGANLSQGQRQLIAIARAAVADPPVMILDEATSSIDTRTEAIVSRGMDKLMEGRTVFVIAHRLSTVMNSDVIMVLDHGRIIERGNHDKLIAEKGTYYQLYTGNAISA